MGTTPTKEIKSVNLRSHPRNTLAHHLRECRLDPFPSENEHSISWTIHEMSGGIVRCQLSGCENCENANVFLETMSDVNGDNFIALRRVVSPSKTVTIKFKGMEDVDLVESVKNNTLTNLLMKNACCYNKAETNSNENANGFINAMNFILSLTEDNLTQKLS